MTKKNLTHSKGSADKLIIKKDFQTSKACKSKLREVIANFFDPEIIIPLCGKKLKKNYGRNFMIINKEFSAVYILAS